MSNHVTIINDMSETLARPESEQTPSEHEALRCAADANWRNLKRQRPESCPEQNLRIDFSPLLPDLEDDDRTFARQYLGWNNHYGLTELKGGCVETCKVQHNQDGKAYAVYFQIDISDIPRELATAGDATEESTYFRLMSYPSTNQTIAEVMLSPKQFAHLRTECYTHPETPPPKR